MRTSIPAEDLFPGSNLTWLSTDDVLKVHPPTTKRDHVLFGFYRSHVGDRMVLPTLRAARDFLVNDAKLVVRDSASFTCR